MIRSSRSMSIFTRKAASPALTKEHFLKFKPKEVLKAVRNGKEAYLFDCGQKCTGARSEVLVASKKDTLDWLANQYESAFSGPPNYGPPKWPTDMGWTLTALTESMVQPFVKEKPEKKDDPSKQKKATVRTAALPDLYYAVVWADGDEAFAEMVGETKEVLDRLANDLVSWADSSGYADLHHLTVSFDGKVAPISAQEFTHMVYPPLMGKAVTEIKTDGFTYITAPPRDYLSPEDWDDQAKEWYAPQASTIAPMMRRRSAGAAVLMRINPVRWGYDAKIVENVVSEVIATTGAKVVDTRYVEDHRMLELTISGEVSDDLNDLVRDRLHVAREVTSMPTRLAAKTQQSKRG